MGFFHLLFISSIFAEIKVFTFDARHNKAHLFATMGADHINLTSKLSPEEERTGTITRFRREKQMEEVCSSCKS